MRIDNDRIKSAFSGKAWAYAECMKSVRIGRWCNAQLEFPCVLDEDGDPVLTLRVFNESRELKFSGDKLRDTDSYVGGDLIGDRDFTDCRYIMYGEHADVDGDHTRLWEERGGILLFPAKLEFPSVVMLKLGIRNFIRYNPIPICRRADPFDHGLGTSGAGALEVFDYAYTGFYYASGKAVEC